MHRLRIVAGLFLLALVLRVVATLTTAVIFNDGPIFLQISQLMKAGAWGAVLWGAFRTRKLAQKGLGFGAGAFVAGAGAGT